MVISSPELPVNLGSTWLRKHNTHIDWSSGEILNWGFSCSTSCLSTANANIQSSDTNPDLSTVPSVYHDLREVFNKHKATSLPPHKYYYCSTDRSSPPQSRLYYLPIPERESMDKYITDFLKAGLIHPSSSPAGGGFFFLGEKDGTIRPCIDYQGLNDFTIKNHYNNNNNNYQ